MNLESIFFRYKLHLILFCVLLFGLWYYFRFQDYDKYANYKILAAKITAVKVIDLAFMVYVTNYLLISRLLYKKKYILFGTSFILLVFGSSVFKMWIEGQMLHDPESFSLFGAEIK